MDNYEQEITELHQFFEDWFNARVQQTAQNLARSTQVIAEEFKLITPQGHLLDQPTIVDVIGDLYGKRLGDRLCVENVSLCHHHASIIVATYEEWQETKAGVTARLSTVIFRQNPAAPNGLDWLHLHETWLPQQEQSDSRE